MLVRLTFLAFWAFLPCTALAEGKGLPQLDSSSYPSQVFWLVIAFAILYAVFARWTLPALSAIVEGRAQRIKDDLEAAASLKAAAQTIHDAYEAQLLKARGEAAALFTQAEADTKAAYTAAQEDFRREAADHLAGAEAAIAKARAKALKELEASVEGLADQVADHLLQPQKAA